MLESRKDEDENRRGSGGGRSPNSPKSPSDNGWVSPKTIVIAVFAIAFFAAILMAIL